MPKQDLIAYDEAEVLMIIWDSANDGRQMKKEAARLAQIFTNELNYNVTQETIHVCEQACWRRRLDQIMDGWMLVRDDLDAFFIIYVAGHGHVFKDEIVGGVMTKKANELRRIATTADFCEYVENKIEHLVSHVFGIWDFSYTDFDLPYPSRIRTVEYITPALKYERTGYPGKRSFTKTLTDAFGELVQKEEEFTSLQLLNTIKAMNSVYALQTKLACSDLQLPLRKRIAFRKLKSDDRQLPGSTQRNPPSLTSEESAISDYTWAEEIERETEETRRGY